MAGLAAAPDPGLGQTEETAGPDSSAAPDASVSTEGLMPFSGWKGINLPTARTVGAGNWLFLISHRFVRPVSTGYSSFYGLDGSAIMHLGMGYAVTDHLLLSLARSNEEDNVELETRYQLMSPRAPNAPVGLAVHAIGNWHSVDRPNQSRWRAAAYTGTAQVSVTRTVADQFGLAVVPGITFNPSTRRSGEAPLVTLGLTGRWKFHPKAAVLAEWIPILSRSRRTVTAANEFGTWGLGLEVMAGGHVFQIVAGNNASLSTDQYLDGGDLDVRDAYEGQFRLGFNIFRILDFSKF